MVSGINSLDLAIPPIVNPLTETERSMAALGVDFGRPNLKPDSCAPLGICQRISGLYKERVSEPTRSMIPHVKKVVSKGISALGAVVNFGLPIIGIIRNAAEMGRKVRNFLKVLRKAKVLAPLALFSVGFGVAEGVKAARKAENKGDGLEAGLLIGENISDAAFIGEAFVAGLGHFGAIAPHAVTTASIALTGVGAVLSVATIILSSKHLYDSTKYRKELTGRFYSLDPDKDHVKETAEFIANTRKRDFKRRFGVSSGGEFKKRLLAIFKKSEDGTIESKEKVEQTVGLMRKRLFSKDLGSVLKIIAAVVSIVALAILFFTPLAPVGWGFLAVAGLVGLGVVIADLVLSRRFKKQIDNLAPIEN